jgi:hypothetical protein
MTEITVEQFKKRLKQPNHPDGFHVAVDSQDKTQLYIAINDGLANIKCDPIELYGTDIKNCVQLMITQSKLFVKDNEKSVRIGQGRSIYGFTLKAEEYTQNEIQKTKGIYFSSVLIRWQRTHKYTDKYVQEKLGLSAKDFQLFREDELEVSQGLIGKLVELTGISEQFWKNRWQQKASRLYDENI